MSMADRFVLVLFCYVNRIGAWYWCKVIINSWQLQIDKSVFMAAYGRSAHLAFQWNLTYSSNEHVQMYIVHTLKCINGIYFRWNLTTPTAAIHKYVLYRYTLRYITISTLLLFVCLTINLLNMENVMLVTGQNEHHAIHPIVLWFLCIKRLKLTAFPIKCMKNTIHCMKWTLDNKLSRLNIINIEIVKWCSTASGFKWSEC